MNRFVKEISILDIQGVSVGHAQDDAAKTGVTVICFEKGAQTGCHISGGGPASRETPLAGPLTADNPINAVVLAGGSAFGLAASDGVMKCLEDSGIGLKLDDVTIPLVCQSCIYDLEYGRSDIRPDAEMGYQACKNSLSGSSDMMGNVGGGTGATVGKLLDMPRAQKSGLGIHVIQAGDLQIAAVVIVNACGDIFDPQTGRKIAGLLDEERKGFVDFEEAMLMMAEQAKAMASAVPEADGGAVASPVKNTTIGCIITNAKFDKTKLCKIAAMAGNAYARCIDPVGMMLDGDTVYASSVGMVESDINLVGTLAARVMEKAIVKAIRSSQIDEAEYRKFAHLE